MKMKTKRYEYKNSVQFLDDFVLMKQNSETYNGISHPVTEIARQHE
jgi:hypothetical protein